MELKIDFVNKKKKILFLVLGLLLVGSKIFIDFYWNKNINSLDWISLGGLISVGLFSIYMGLEKSYILINTEQIFLKKPIFEKNLFVTWNEIKSINPKITRIEIQKTDDTILKLYFDWFSYESVKKIKKTILDIAKEKNIQIKTES